VRVTSLFAFVSKGSIQPSHIRDEAGPRDSTSARGVSSSQKSGSRSAEERGQWYADLAWILLGLIAGFVTSKFVNQTGQNVPTDIAIGVGGALAGGWIFRQLGQPGATGSDLWSLLVAVVGAVVGAVVLLVLYPTVTGIAPRRT
jgi:uncharacterized membrane protein YeaQ/YmgE (transglycosylase-associated protein family)